jgi:hypothetical protein
MDNALFRRDFCRMKNVFVLLLGVVLLTGYMMHHYDITLINGGSITHVSKPKFDKETGYYSYTNMRGEKRTISASRVVEIAPHHAPKKVKGASPPQS